MSPECDWYFTFNGQTYGPYTEAEKYRKVAELGAERTARLKACGLDIADIGNIEISAWGVPICESCND